MLLSPLDVPGRYMTYCSCAVGIWLTAHAQQGYDFVLMRRRDMTSCSCSEVIWLYCSCTAGMWICAYAQQGYYVLLMRSDYYFSVQATIPSQLNWAILLCDSYLTENRVNCAVLTGNNAGHRTVLSSRISHREPRSSLKESHSERQPCSYPPLSHAQEDTQNWQTWWETCAVPENIQFSFFCSFLNS